MSSKHAVRLTRTINQSIANGSQTAVSWDSVLLNQGDLFNPATPEKITIKRDGLYQLGCDAEFVQNGNGQRSAQLLLTPVGGGPAIVIAEETRLNNGGFLDSWAKCVTLRKLQAGDEISVRVYQSSGGSLNLKAVSEYAPLFWLIESSRSDLAA